MKRKMDLLKTIMLLSLFFLSFSFFVQEIKAKEFDNCQLYRINQYIEEELSIDWDCSRSLATPYVYASGIVFVNMTLLPTSNSNVSLIFVDDERVTWSPIPLDNFTLNQGESYSQTFALVSSGVGYSGSIHFSCAGLQENATATILWGYNVLIKGTSPVSLGFIPVLIGLILLSSSFYLLKRKSKKN